MEQALEQIESWPYNFPASEDFPKSAQRGNVSGTLLIKDRYHYAIIDFSKISFSLLYCIYEMCDAGENI